MDFVQPRLLSRLHTSDEPDLFWALVAAGLQHRSPTETGHWCPSDECCGLSCHVALPPELFQWTSTGGQQHRCHLVGPSSYEILRPNAAGLLPAAQGCSLVDWTRQPDSQCLGNLEMQSDQQNVHRKLVQVRLSLVCAALVSSGVFKINYNQFIVMSHESWGIMYHEVSATGFVDCAVVFIIIYS